MKRQILAARVAIVLGVVLSGARVLTQSHPATEGPAVDGSPAWFLQGSFPDPTGRTSVDATGQVTVLPRGTQPVASAAPALLGTETPPCRHSPLCGNRLGRSRQTLQRVQWKQTMGYAFTYPYVLPPGPGDAGMVGARCSGGGPSAGDPAERDPGRA